MKEKYVAFQNKKTENAFEELAGGKFEDKKLKKFIDRAIEDLKENPLCGIKIRKKLWPKDYSQEQIDNLWKYNLPGAWRLIYTIKGNDVMIISVILEWFNHKDYEKRFKF